MVLLVSLFMVLAEIAYIRLEQGFVYLAAVLDVYSRRVLGWSLSNYLDKELTLVALDESLQTRQGMDLSGLIHHSDQGVQYASHDYNPKLKD